MQPASDLFLGWTEGIDGRQFNVRQMKDMKMNQAEREYVMSLEDTTGEPLDDMVFHQVVKRIVSTAIEQRIRDQ